ncbi:Hsp20 family protein [Aurantivibrio infirmus]
MRTLDFAPLYRSSIGFDRIANLLDSLPVNQQSQSNYPPYNIEVESENEYRVSMAVAGFDRDELEIESEQNTLVVRGKKREEKEERKFLHQGIAARNFERRFQLADYVRVSGANHENGLLHIELVRELPEVMKPRSIEIKSQAAPEKRKLSAA